jgi:gliding motility-associated-like protein
MGNSTGEEVKVAPLIPTLYYLRGEDANGCIKFDSIVVKPASANPKNQYLVPNAFTPNGDGLNDCFGIGHWGTLQNLSFRIVDRWGNTAFYSKSNSLCWDGNYIQGKQAVSGTYLYQIEAQSPCGIIRRWGTVQLLR